MDIHFITVPYDSGARGRGMALGPGRILSSGLIDRLKGSGHRVSTTTVSYPEEHLPEIQSAFRLNSILSGAVSAAVEAGGLPIVLAGNCNASLGALSGLHSNSIRLLWLDAHGDYNTPETTVSGYFDGMALAVITGRCWQNMAGSVPSFRPLPEDRVVLLGARDLDVLEREVLSAGSIYMVDADRIRRDEFRLAGIPEIPAGEVFIHLDVDVMDKSVGSANRYASGNGLYPGEIEKIFSHVVDHSRVAGMTVAAYDPSFDPEGRIAEAAGQILLSTISLVSRSRP
jgi:arginase